MDMFTSLNETRIGATKVGGGRALGRCAAKPDAAILVFFRSGGPRGNRNVCPGMGVRSHVAKDCPASAGAPIISIASRQLLFFNYWPGRRCAFAGSAARSRRRKKEVSMSDVDPCAIRHDRPSTCSSRWAFSPTASQVPEYSEALRSNRPTGRWSARANSVDRGEMTPRQSGGLPAVNRRCLRRGCCVIRLLPAINYLGAIRAKG